MHSGARHIRQRRIAAFVALWALWLHALLPPGFMPGAGAAGAPNLVICAGGLPTHLSDALGRTGSPPAAEHGPASDHCVFAAVAAIAPADAPQPAFQPTAATPPRPAFAYDQVRSDADGPPLGARAPPVSRFA